MDAVRRMQGKLYIAGQRFGKTFQGIQVQMQLVDEAQQAAEAKALKNFAHWQHEFTLATGTASHQLIELMSGFKIEPVLKDESVRDRALRLKKQPHSMASGHNHFDHRGRRRY